jgi:hypothetical protein
MGENVVALGPVSGALEADLRAWVVKHGIVVWIDPLHHFTRLVDSLAATRAKGSLPYAVHAFRGSHLALMLELEAVAKGAARPALVVHMPGFNEDTIRQTPLLELYEAGVRYRKGLDGVVADAAAGRVRPEEIASFKAREKATLEEADEWLEAQLAGDGGGLAAQLRLVGPEAVLSDLLSRGPLAARAAHHADAQAIAAYLASALAIPAAWPARVLGLDADAPFPQPLHRAEDLAFAAASWCLCVEYVDDLARAPKSVHLADIRALPRAIGEVATKVATLLREQHDRFYARTADETEALIAEEIKAGAAAELGKVDTFRFEEARIFHAALDLLDQGQWETAAQWSTQRLEPKTRTSSFWVQRDPTRTAAWQLVRQAARLGLALEKAGPTLPSRDGVPGAVEAYATKGAGVDQAHRHLEQLRAALLDPTLPDFETLRARLDGMRRLWRTWADAWTKSFGALCKSHGFVPPASLQQRTIFDEIVGPYTQELGTTAYFVVDALRFEMAEELHRALADTPASTVRLQPRLAELPTVTEVGMNVLAPVASNGKLTPALKDDHILGFESGEFRVVDIETRRRAMMQRAHGRACPWLTLGEVEAEDLAKLRRVVEQTRLLVVHSREIDEAGESGAGPAVFDQVIRRLRGAWQRLREAGVRRFVITSDHGFLLVDERAGAVQPHGRRIDPKRRHVLTSVGADYAGEVRVPLADLGYLGTNAHVLFPETTAVFDTVRRGETFVHGGNSLQERVIPVLTLEHRAAKGSSSVEYRVTAERAEPMAHMECVRVSVGVLAQIGLDFGGAKEVDLGLRVLGEHKVEVELCHARGRARIEGTVVRATVGETFELFFRLKGAEETRVAVEVYHPGGAATVAPASPPERFPVSALARAHTAPPASPATGESEPPAAPARRGGEAVDWRARISDERVREVFVHLHAHGSITETEVAQIVGSPRAARAFALRLTEWAAMAPFDVRVETVGSMKRYVREGKSE